LKTIYSFDVFDTCLTRRTTVPSSVFYGAAEKVFTRLGISSDRSILEDFVAARIGSERSARRQTSREDVTLDEIWRILIRLMGWPSDGSLAACELEAEEELLVPISSILSKVQAARRQGSRIIFISDMYLPAEFIERQLKKHGFAETGDGIYVSGEIGKTKATGNLFRHMLAEEKITAEMVIHTGDNHRSDFTIPSQLGIQARLFDAVRMTQTELGVSQTEGDPQPATKIAGAMRAFRLGGKPEDNDPVHELASQFVGPFVMGFAIWVLQRAQENGVKRLYFLSRDGQLLCKVARALSPQFGGIDCQYLYVSRQSLSLPSADAISPEGMPWMRRDWEEPVLKKLLAKIDLTYESVESFFGALAGDQGEACRLKSEEDWSRFWNALNTEPLKTRINQLIVTRRNLTRDYFEAAGLFDPIPWAIVDLGWALTCQQALGRLLKRWGRQGKIKGYYFGLLNQRAGCEEAGSSEALFYQPAPDFPVGTKVTAILDRITLLEHIIGCADHPTVHHHERLAGGNMGATYASSMTESALDFCRQLHEQSLDFVRRNPALVEDFKSPSICRGAMASLVTSFFAFPSGSSASALLGLSATMDQNGLNPMPIVKPLNWRKALLPLWPKPEPFMEQWKRNDSFWLEGSLAITPSGVRRLLTLTHRVANRWARIRGAV
jgi:predicted HAD superfamily hydrolase